ncbi:MAG TPA: histone deacetylase [Solirubrobacterales bacterium]|nr:histone deacetylase [Solirubrobacterales bacterium]
MGLYVSHPSSHRHDTGAHPENAGRLVAIEQTLESADWLGLERVEAPAATRDQLLRVHPAEHIDRIEEFCRAGGGMLDMDTTVSPESYEAALHAAGGAADTAARLLSGEDRFAFCGLRPPGHHAEAAAPMGFCLFNNAALAAAEAIAVGGVERVFIFDWDVHHGNGTEAIFAGSAEVFYASVHQWPLYPGTGAAEYRGEGEGEGYTLNLPVSPGTGTEEFLALVQHVVAPAAREFEPGLLIVSAGYDAHRDDPLASCMVETQGYAEMAATMRELGSELGAPVLYCLEGGYSPRALAASVLATIEAMEGGDAPREAPAAAAEPHLSRVRGVA